MLIAGAFLASADAILLVVPMAAFWCLDGYFLGQERIFRHVYNDIRKSSDTNFAMDVAKHLGKAKTGWISAACSRTLAIFYLSEIAALVAMWAL